jgi:hypothetical protein
MRDHHELPAFHHAHELTLAVHEATCRIAPAVAGGLSVRLRAAALSAAGAVVRGSVLPSRLFLVALAQAASRLHEVAYYIDLGQRLGHLDLGTAAELLAQQSRANLEVESLARSLVQAAPVRPAGRLVLGGAREEVAGAA